MNKNKFPAGWDEKRLRKVLAHYENQTEAEKIAEDEAAYRQQKTSMVGIPVELVPKVCKLIARHRIKKQIAA